MILMSYLQYVKNIVRDQQEKFLWIKTYNWQENYFQFRGNWSFWSRTIFLHTVLTWVIFKIKFFGNI